MPRWCHPLMSGSLVAIILAAGLVAQTALRAQETRSSTRLTTEHFNPPRRAAQQLSLL